MTSYPNSGAVSFTGWSNTLGSANATDGVTSGSAFSSGLSNTDQRLAMLLNKPGAKKIKALIKSLVDGAVGDSAASTYGRLTAVQGYLSAQELGGLRAIETVTVINRVTVAGDITNLDLVLARTSKPSSYASDASGNGGGGKVGY
jgi:hypothetical protein